MIDFMNVHIYIKNKILNLFLNIKNGVVSDSKTSRLLKYLF